MRTLQFRSPAAFTQSLRMRRNAAPKGTQFLVVEGVSDKKSFQPLLDPGLQYVPARGKEMVLSAFETLRSEGVDDCLFIVDCDGSMDAFWLGQRGLIVSNNRDIDADLLFELGAFQRVSLEYLSDFGLTATECRAIGDNLLRYAQEITSSFGILLDAARDEKANTNFLDTTTNARRRIRLQDLPELGSWVQHFVPVFADDLLPVAATVLSWNSSEVAGILARVQSGSEKLCRTHETRHCEKCTPRRYSNGHDLVDVLALGLSQRCGYKVSEAEFARATRLATSADAMGAWDVAVRIRKWQNLEEIVSPDANGDIPLLVTA